MDLKDGGSLVPVTTIPDPDWYTKMKQMEPWKDDKPDDNDDRAGVADDEEDENDDLDRRIKYDIAGDKHPNWYKKQALKSKAPPAVADHDSIQPDLDNKNQSGNKKKRRRRNRKSGTISPSMSPTPPMNATALGLTVPPVSAAVPTSIIKPVSAA